MAYLSWSDATERVAKGLHSYDWELEVVVEAGSAEDVPINIEGKEDGDEWLLEWSFDVSGGAVEFGIEVDEEVALDLTTLRSEMDDGIAEGRVMIDSRAQALLLVFENQRGFWFSSSETKRITGVVKIVRREMGGESAATGGGLMLSSSRGQFPARRRVRKKAKEGGRRKQPRAMRSERRMPRTVGGGGGGVRGGGRRKRRAKKGRPLLSSVSSCTTTTSSCSTSESGSGSSSESSGEEETSVTSAASEGTSGGGTEAGTLVTPEDYTEELEYMEAMLRFKEERHVQKTAPPPRGGGEWARGARHCEGKALQAAAPEAAAPEGERGAAAETRRGARQEQQQRRRRHRATRRFGQCEGTGAAAPLQRAEGASAGSLQISRQRRRRRRRKSGGARAEASRGVREELRGRGEVRRAGTGPRTRDDGFCEVARVLRSPARRIARSV